MSGFVVVVSQREKQIKRMIKEKKTNQQTKQQINQSKITATLLKLMFFNLISEETREKGKKKPTNIPYNAIYLFIYTLVNWLRISKVHQFTYTNIDHFSLHKFPSSYAYGSKIVEEKKTSTIHEMKDFVPTRR